MLRIYNGRARHSERSKSARDIIRHCQAPGWAMRDKMLVICVTAELRDEMVQGNELGTR